MTKLTLFLVCLAALVCLSTAGYYGGYGYRPFYGGYGYGGGYSPYYGGYGYRPYYGGYGYRPYYGGGYGLYG